MPLLQFIHMHILFILNVHKYEECSKNFVLLLHMRVVITLQWRAHAHIFCEGSMCVVITLQWRAHAHIFCEGSMYTKCIFFVKVVQYYQTHGFIRTNTDFWHNTGLTYRISKNTDFFPFSYGFFIKMLEWS